MVLLEIVDGGINYLERQELEDRDEVLKFIAMPEFPAELRAYVETRVAHKKLRGILLELLVGDPKDRSDVKTVLSRSIFHPENDSTEVVRAHHQLARQVETLDKIDSKIDRIGRDVQAISQGIGKICQRMDSLEEIKFHVMEGNGQVLSALVETKAILRANHSRTEALLANQSEMTADKIRQEIHTEVDRTMEATAELVKRLPPNGQVGYTCHACWQVCPSAPWLLFV